MNLVPFKAAGGPPAMEGGLWGHFPALRLELAARDEPVEASQQAREAKALELGLRAVRAVEDVLGDGDWWLEARALWGVRDGWTVTVTPSEGRRWNGRAALLRYARAVRRHGLPREGAMR